MSQPTFLMCTPRFFGVEYVINPWMSGQIGAVDHAAALDQWDRLYSVLTDDMGACVKLMEPVEGLPDLVFTANAGLVHGGQFVPARFRHPERAGEEPYYRSWFVAAGFEVVDAGGYNEGAGDMLPLQGRLFGGYGFRTDIDAHRAVERAIGLDVESFELVDPRYYHIDTCFCPLPDDKLIWHPPAFSPASAARIEQLVPKANRYEVSDSDGALFACNAVAVPGHVVLNSCGPELVSWLADHSLRVHQTPLTEFMKAGGSAKCLTLRLDTAE